MDVSALIWFLIVGGWLLGPVLGTGTPNTGGGTLNYILTALIGAVVLLFIASLFTRRSAIP